MDCPVCKKEVNETRDTCQVCSWKFIDVSEIDTQDYDEKIEKHREIYESILNTLLQNNQKKLILEEYSLDQFEKKLDSKIDNIFDIFEEKLLYDETKEKQIDKLHSELQKYKTDLIAKTNRPLVNGVIRIFDDLNKLIYHMGAKKEELTPEKFFKVLDGVKEDIEILLDQNGVLSFSESGEIFEPKRQQAISSVKTLDQDIVGKIAKRIRVGFEQADDLIQKERVSVYILDNEEKEESKNENIEKKVENLTESLANDNMEENNE